MAQETQGASLRHSARETEAREVRQRVVEFLSSATKLISEFLVLILVGITKLASLAWFMRWPSKVLLVAQISLLILWFKGEPVAADILVYAGIPGNAAIFGLGIGSFQLLAAHWKVAKSLDEWRALKGVHVAVWAVGTFLGGAIIFFHLCCGFGLWLTVPVILLNLFLTFFLDVLRADLVREYGLWAWKIVEETVEEVRFVAAPAPVQVAEVEFEAEPTGDAVEETADSMAEQGLVQVFEDTQKPEGSVDQGVLEEPEAAIVAETNEAAESENLDSVLEEAPDLAVEPEAVEPTGESLEPIREPEETGGAVEPELVTLMSFDLSSLDEEMLTQIVEKDMVIWLERIAKKAATVKTKAGWKAAAEKFVPSHVSERLSSGDPEILREALLEAIGSYPHNLTAVVNIYHSPLKYASMKEEGGSAGGNKKNSRGNRHQNSKNRRKKGGKKK